MGETVPRHSQHRVAGTARKPRGLGSVTIFNCSENFLDPFRIPPEPPATPPDGAPSTTVSRLSNDRIGYITGTPSWNCRSTVPPNRPAGVPEMGGTAAEDSSQRLQRDLCASPCRTGHRAPASTLAAGCSLSCRPGSPGAVAVAGPAASSSQVVAVPAQPRCAAAAGFVGA